MDRRNHSLLSPLTYFTINIRIIRRVLQLIERNESNFISFPISNMAQRWNFTRQGEDAKKIFKSLKLFIEVSNSFFSYLPLSRLSMSVKWFILAAIELLLYMWNKKKCSLRNFQVIFSDNSLNVITITLIEAKNLCTFNSIRWHEKRLSNERWQLQSTGMRLLIAFEKRNGRGKNCRWKIYCYKLN